MTGVKPHSELYPIRHVTFAAGDGTMLRGDLMIPPQAKGVVIFAHGSGSNRHSPRNRFVASQLEEAGYASLLVDLVTPAESDPSLELLSTRLIGATQWIGRAEETRELPLAYFGASTGAAVALIAAAREPGWAQAIVSRGGRPDLVPPVLLARVEGPVLLIVGSLDLDVLALNRRALRLLRCDKSIYVVPGATHLFEEPGTLETVADETRRFLDAALSAERLKTQLLADAEEPAQNAREDALGSYLALGHTGLFKDRRDAGVKLALALDRYQRQHVIVLGIPRGGVPVAYEVAKRLDAELDVMIARKLGAPGQEELAIGAVTADGTRYLNDEIVRSLDVDEAYLARVTAEQSAEARRRERLFRSGLPAPDLSERTVLLVDDGLATGATMHAAVRSLRRRRVGRLIVATPVGAPQTCRRLTPEVDELVCLRRPEPFYSVGRHYEQFEQTSDAEVLRLLGEAHKLQNRRAKPNAVAAVPTPDAGQSAGEGR